ncbi:unnamed protein product [Linum trigynum]|uniref:Uncharacterized protein n=1 Tax=Linum trigynum TaxID=586398 RepID=A0AAV2CDU5_9ROSI
MAARRKSAAAARGLLSCLVGRLAAASTRKERREEGALRRGARGGDAGALVERWAMAGPTTARREAERRKAGAGRASCCELLASA